MSLPALRTFASLGLDPGLATIVAGLGYEEPTPIQREAIPILLEGRDLLGQAATGTGKTAAFALPMLQRIAAAGAVGKATSGLILVPTRELAMQVAEAVHKYGKGLGVSVLPLYGGAPMHQQIAGLARGAAIVVATPGRALDHIRRGTLKLNAVTVTVLDEADEMLDMGFADDIEAILGGTPSTRQTALFSATMPKRILAIADRHLRDPHRISIAREKPAAGAVPRVRQVAYVVQRAHKPAALERLLDMEDPEAALVFCRTRQEVESLVETLNAHGHRALALHGGMLQRQRDRVMSEVRSRKADLLVATDVAARGLDIEHLTHVVNYDVPSAPEVYLHRIGRTGRAGRGGTAITLVEAREHRLLRSIEHFTKSKIDVVTLPTVADVRERRLDLTRAALREALTSGNADEFRVIVDTLAQEFDIVDVAAAAVKMAHTAATGEGTEQEIPAARLSPPETAARESRSPGPRGKPGRRIAGESIRLFVGAGRRDGVRPADLVGAITGEAGIPSRALGAIEITDRFALIEVPADRADAIITAMKQTTLRGKRVTIRREQSGRPT